MSSQELIPVKRPALSLGARKTLLVIGVYGVGLCWFGAIALLFTVPGLAYAIPHLLFFPVLFSTGLYAAWRLWLREPVAVSADGRHRKPPHGQHRKVAGRQQHRQPGPTTKLGQYPASHPRFFNGLAVVAAYAAVLCWIGMMGLLTAGNGLAGVGPLVLIPILATLSAVAIARFVRRSRASRTLPY
jgi:hypothetical protein